MIRHSRRKSLILWSDFVKDNDYEVINIISRYEWFKFVLTRRANGDSVELWGRFEDEDTISIDDVGICVKDELYNARLGTNYEVKEIIGYYPENVICKCKKKEKYTMYFINKGNIAYGNNNTQNVYNNDSSFDAEEFVKDMKKYLIEKDVDVEDIVIIKNDLRELADEIKNNGANTKVKGILTKIKEKAKDIPFDIIKDGIEECIKNPAILTGIISMMSTL